MLHKRTLQYQYLHQNEPLKIKDLLGMSIYNFGTKPIIVFGIPLRAYDENRGPDVYVLDTLPIPYQDDLEIEIRFTGENATENKAYIVYSALKTC